MSITAVDADQSAASGSVREWPTDSTLYELMGKIGRGAFATVWKARTKQEPPLECAIKVLNLDHVDSDLQEIRREVQAMKLSSHPNVLTCFTAFVHDIHLWLATPLMHKGSSVHCFQTARQQHARATGHSNLLMEKHILYVLRESLLGLQYIHNHGQIHRDIKGGNILIDSDGSVRIADFGVSGWIGGSSAGVVQRKAKTFVGSPCWMSPEIMEQMDGYDFKTDVWSLGITALELAKGYPPYARYPPMKVLILTIQEDPPNLDTYLTLEEETDSDNLHHPHIAENYSKVFRSLVDWCLQKNPDRRPTCADLLQHRALQAMDDPSHRNERQSQLKTLTEQYVPDVGATASSSNNQQSAAPGGGAHASHVSFIIEQSNSQQERPKGTTWVFADGSQVLSSAAMQLEEDGNGDTDQNNMDDVMAQLDEFGKETGGENYDRSTAVSNRESQQRAGNAASSAAAPMPAPAIVPTGGTADDDLDQFLDDFELNMPGEDFRHPGARS